MLFPSFTPYSQICFHQILRNFLSKMSSSSSQPSEASKFTAEQMRRMVQCRTAEGNVLEVPWHLMAQSGTFAQMWEDLGMEESDKGNDSGGNGSAPFIFPLNQIGENLFKKVLQWMENHHGKPVPVVQEDPSERVWLQLTDWERQFLDVDLEELKALMVAANFLDIRSLYLYTGQQIAKAIMDKEPAEQREMLGL